MSIRTTARDEAAGQIHDILAGRSGQEQQLSEKHNPLVFEFEEHPTGCGSAPKSQIGKTNKISIPPHDSGLDMESGLWNQGPIGDSEPGDSGLEFRGWNPRLDFGLGFRARRG